MGANPVTSGEHRTYFNIVQGRFAVRVKEGDEGAIKRVIVNKKDKSEKTVFEKYYESIDAHIESIDIDESGDYGDQVKVNMKDADERFTVTLPLNGREAKSFLSCLKNIDMSKEVTLDPFNFEGKDGKQVIGLGVYQGAKNSENRHPKENKVPFYFTKETPNGLPQVAEGADKDEFKLAMQSQTIFLKKWAKGFLAEMGKKAESTPPPVHTEDSGAEEIDPDLGF